MTNTLTITALPYGADYPLGKEGPKRKCHIHGLVPAPSATFAYCSDCNREGR